jgi:hypothetical protein
MPFPTQKTRHWIYSGDEDRHDGSSTRYLTTCLKRPLEFQTESFSEDALHQSGSVGEPKNTVGAREKILILCARRGLASNDRELTFGRTGWPFSKIHRPVPFPVPNIRELSGVPPHSTKLPDFGAGGAKK